MKKLFAWTAVLLLAGCSSMGMRHTGTSSASARMPATSSGMAAANPGMPAGTDTTASGGMASAGATGATMVPIPGTDPSRAPTASPNTWDVIDPRTGQLTIYHGG